MSKKIKKAEQKIADLRRELSSEAALIIIDNLEKEWGRPIPVELRRLVEFQADESDFEQFSQGFGIWEADFYGGLKEGWSDNPEFLGKLYPFAQANGSGSTYAIWDDGEGYPMGDMPVVVFGDEGGQWVVANHFGAFLQLLTFDTEISVDWNSCFFYKDEEGYEENPDAEKFRQWFSEYQGYLPTVESNEHAAAILADAQANHQQKFNEWLGRFGIETSENTPDETLQVASLPPQLVQEKAPKHYNINGDKYPQAWEEKEYEYGGDYDGEDFSEIEAEFELIEFLPRLPEPYKLEQYERLWVDLRFKTNVPCQVWLLQADGYNGTYSASKVYSVGETKTYNFLNFHQVPENERIDHLNLHIAFVNGQELEAKIPFDCQITPPSDTDTLYDGESTTELNGEVTLVVGGNTLLLNEAHQIPVGADVDVIIPYKTGSKYGINLFSMPVEGMEQCGSNYPIGFNGSDEYYGPWGVATATFSAYAPCKPPYLQVYAQNLTGGWQIFSKNIPINIEFIETEGDGQGSEITAVGIRLAGEEDWLDGKATINTETDLELHYEYKNASQHGIYFKLYSVKNNEISEQLLQSNTLADPNRTWGYIDFVIDEAQEMEDVILVMYNTAGEVLHERLLQLKLNVEEYDRPRKKAQREEDSKPTGLFGSLKKFFNLD
ncbi:MAG: SMI1/KNR4 family protein [Alysiella sp.]|uniref:SMI1/KNR4 family protein n=1 Tax=Alysiella sp. TaxID=1872483 RepID=UPI0026DB5E9B|nr:SMI1/KNR4 family protein [Alysiella sp.]MDO4434007.1 SMI1/KNR4 family protein [Alysiella sp.]